MPHCTPSGYATDETLVQVCIFQSLSNQSESLFQDKTGKAVKKEANTMSNWLVKKDVKKEDVEDDKKVKRENVEEDDKPSKKSKK